MIKTYTCFLLFAGGLASCAGVVSDVNEAPATFKETRTIKRVVAKKRGMDCAVSAD